MNLTPCEIIPIYILYKANVNYLVYKLNDNEFKTPQICPIWKTVNIWLRKIKALYRSLHAALLELTHILTSLTGSLIFQVVSFGNGTCLNMIINFIIHCYTNLFVVESSVINSRTWRSVCTADVKPFLICSCISNYSINWMVDFGVNVYR